MSAKFFKRLLVSLLVLAVAGCPMSSNSSKIKGTEWASEPILTQGKELPAGAFLLQFKSDGRLVYKIGSQTIAGSYTLGVGEKVTFSFDQELAGKKTHLQTVKIRGDRLEMTDSDGHVLLFVKRE